MTMTMERLQISDTLKESLKEKLDKIRSPNLEGQKQNARVLETVEEILQAANKDFSPHNNFSALLDFLRLSISEQGSVNRERATSSIYLLDVFAPCCTPLLRSQFSEIFTKIAPVFSLPDADAPILRPSIGCLESLLLAQDAAAWRMSQNQLGPRHALANFLQLALDHRPKIRKRAQDAISTILQNPPPSPSLDHPASDMCAETALKCLTELAGKSILDKKQKKATEQVSHEPSLIHALQLVRTIAEACGGWPSTKIEVLCEALLGIARSSNEYMTKTAFEVFEIILAGMANDPSGAKIHRLLEAISELQPSQSDTQLLPSWIAVISKGYNVAAQLEATETFQKLPELFVIISSFLSSSSHDIRVSASLGLMSFMANCIPSTVILEPSIYDEKTLEKLGKAALNLLSVKYQGAWMESFNVFEAMFEALRWKSDPVMVDILRTIGELRDNDDFKGKKEAEKVIGKALQAMGPEAVLNILPLNLPSRAGQTGRPWLVTLMAKNIKNTNLDHFKKEMLPLSKVVFNLMIAPGVIDTAKKVIEGLFDQIWALLPRYCTMPLDLTQSYDQAFAEQLYSYMAERPELRKPICKAWQALVESNKATLESEEDDDLLFMNRISKADAQANIDHLAGMVKETMLALFNLYGTTLPKDRAYILQCMDAYLSITPTPQLVEIFGSVTEQLASSLEQSVSQTQADKQKQKKVEDQMPPASHSLMDIVIAISKYLPQESFTMLFEISSRIIAMHDDPQLQKKAYKLIPRLAKSPSGHAALKERNVELQNLLVGSADKVSMPAKGDRLEAISVLVPFLPDDSLHFIPSILSEVINSCKESNARARENAFNLLVLMGNRIVASPTAFIQLNKVPGMSTDAAPEPATIDGYFQMVSLGLRGTTPHVQSATIIACTRILFEFMKSVSRETLVEMFDIGLMFLKNNDREIVGSTLGLIKLCVLSMPTEVILPRLQILMPNLMRWSHEHKAHFKLKIKHIITRMMRRFGVDTITRNCPEEDRKLITNIRKTTERNKRHKEAAKADAEDGSEGAEASRSVKRKSRFESEYDEAIYGSDFSDDDSDASDNEASSSKRNGKKGGKTYIVEDDDDPLDLLDPRALANISSTKPNQRKIPVKTKAKTNADGKLIFGGPDSDDEDAMDVDILPATNGESSTGVGAYVDAISGKDAVKRGQKGRLKFSNKKGQEERDDDEKDIDEEGGKKKTNGSRSSSGRGGISAGRRGLGEQKRSGGGGGGHRVEKSSRDRGSNGRGRGGRGRGGQGRGRGGGGGFRK